MCVPVGAGVGAILGIEALKRGSGTSATGLLPVRRARVMRTTELMRRQRTIAIHIVAEVHPAACILTVEADEQSRTVTGKRLAARLTDDPHLNPE